MVTSDSPAMAFGSSSATMVPVGTIPQKELRNNVGDVLRRAQAGERITVTVSGRPVAELVPLRRTRWVTGADLGAVWNTTAPQTMDGDLERFPAAVVDPFA